MKNFFFVLIALELLVLSMLVLTPRPNEPPVMSTDLYPSCHWDGTQDKNDWKVVFSDFGFDPKTKRLDRRVWEQTVAKGVSEKAAENLCDAFVTTRANTKLEK